jgi:vacuolar-type H+-ATPase subunit E/Vma4
VKLGEGGLPNLLIQKSLQKIRRPTNQGVGSSNLSGRARLNNGTETRVERALARLLLWT